MPEHQRVSFTSPPDERIRKILHTQSSPVNRTALAGIEAGTIQTLDYLRNETNSSRPNARRAMDQLVDSGLIMTGRTVTTTTLGEAAIGAYGDYAQSLIDPYFALRSARLRELGRDFEDQLTRVQESWRISRESNSPPEGIYQDLALAGDYGVIDILSSFPVNAPGISIPEGLRWLISQGRTKYSANFGANLGQQILGRYFANKADQKYRLTSLGAAVLEGFDTYQETLRPFMSSSN